MPFTITFKKRIFRCKSSKTCSDSVCYKLHNYRKYDRDTKSKHKYEETKAQFAKEKNIKNQVSKIRDT